MRERIRINGKPLGEEVFAKYFFEVWDKWEKNNSVRSLISDGERGANVPPPTDR